MLPVYFEKDPSAPRFQSRAQGRGLLFEAGDIQIAFGKGRTVGLRFQDGRHAEPRGTNRTGAFTNYFIGNWQARREHYDSVVYDQIWPGIDLKFYGKGNELEYDFQVAAGADPNAIRLQTSGVGSLRLDPQGDLWIVNGGSRLRQRRPVIYQVIDGQRREVAGGYQIRGKQIGFWLGGYDHSQPLVIDPVLEFATYLGGQGFDVAMGMALDSSNNIYVTGYTELSDFLRSKPGAAFETNRKQEAFLAKLDAKTKQIVYLIFYGGSGSEQPWSIAVDRDGAPTIAGRTSSPDLPLMNPSLRTSQLIDVTTYAFAARFTADGTQRTYSTYLAPGSAFGVAVDSNGSGYIVGNTFCTASVNDTQHHEFVPTNGALETTCADPGFFPAVGFLVRLDRNGNRGYASYFAGRAPLGASNGVSDVALDAQGNVYVAGTTASNNQIPKADGTKFDSDCDVAKIDKSLTFLSWFRQIGGNREDECLRMAIDSAGNAYATGYTLSTNFPVSNGAFQTSMGLGSTDQIPDTNPAYPGKRPLFDGFVVKLTADQGQVTYSSFLGGNGDDYGLGIAADSSGKAYLTGYTNSRNFQVTSGAYQTSFGGGKSDAFLVTVAADGKSLVHSSFYGGLGQDEGYQVAVDTDGNLWVAGGSDSSNLSVTSDASQLSGQTSDAFLAKLNLQTCQVRLSNQNGTVSGAGGTFRIDLTTDTTGCAWSASSLSSFLTISPTSGTGRATLQVTLPQNTAAGPRTGFFQVNGQRNFLVQDGSAPCRFVITPGELAVSSSVERHSIDVQASSSTCSWTARSDQSWVTVAPSSGSGTGTIQVVTAANSSSTVRTASLLIGSEPAIPVSQSAGQCPITLSSAAGTISPAGGLGSVDVLTTSEICGWQAQVKDTWISVLFASSGFGNGKVRFAVAPNTTGVMRTGTIIIAGQSFQINQDLQYSNLRDTAGSLVASTTPSSAEQPRSPGAAALSTCGLQKPATPIQLDSNGTAVVVNLIKQFAGCAPFDPTSNPTWLHITLINGQTASPQLRFSADVNNQTTAPRNGTVTWITGDTNAGTWQLDVSQAGAVRTKLAVQPSTQPQTLSADGGEQNVTVAAADGVSPCAWSIDPSGKPDWLHPDTMSGACNSTLHLSYDANPAASARTAALQFDTGQSFNLVQDPKAPPPPACVYNFTETSPVSVPALGGTVTLHVTAGPGACGWSASTNHNDFVSFPQGANGTGTATLALSVAANTLPGVRMAKISIGDDVATAFLSQQAAPACTFTLSSATANVSAAASSGSFQVQTTSGCAWQAVAPSAATWLRISGATAGIGNGTVNYTVDATAGAGRTASIVVQGQSFTVVQSGASATQTLSVSSPTLSFSAAPGAGVLPTQQEQLTASGGASPFSLTSTTQSGGNWLKVSPTSGATPATLTVTADATGLGAGNYTGTITISSPNAAQPVTVTVNLNLTSGSQPVISQVRNAASYQTGTVSPGENIALFGTGLGPAALVQPTVSASGPYPSLLSETQVFFDSTPAPIIYVSATQTSVMVPYEISGRANTVITVVYKGVTSAPLNYPVAAAVPGIYTQNASGTGPGSILNQDFTINRPGNGESVGRVIAVYMTGEGATNPQSVSGGVAPINGTGLFKPTLPVTATVGGVQANVNYYGSAPALIYGVMQVNLTIPPGLAAGPQPIVINVGNNSTQTGVTVTVK